MSTEATITTDDTDSACQTERIDYTWITPAAINDELERIGDGGCYLAEMMGDPSDRDVAAMAPATTCATADGVPRTPRPPRP